MRDARFIDHFRVRHHQCGSDGCAKLHCVLDYLQDAAAEHASQLGFGMEDLQAAGMIWVLSRLRLTIGRMPRLGETISVETYPSGVEKLFAARQYRVKAGDEVLLTGSSAWLVLDRERYRPLPPAKVLRHAMPENADAPRFHAMPDKIESVELSGPRRVFEVGYADIDLNDHLNNAVYARYLLDLFDAPPRFETLQINFLHAGALHDRIGCALSLEQDGSFYCDGAGDDGTLRYFQMKGTVRTK